MRAPRGINYGTQAVQEVWTFVFSIVQNCRISSICKHTKHAHEITMQCVRARACVFPFLL